MVLWTIQPEGVWQVLNKKGIFKADGRRIWAGNWNFYIHNAYKWMSRQMRLRVGKPPNGVQFPVWAWYQYDKDMRKPDLRSGGHLLEGEKGVRIELEVEDNKVLLSDFDSWHYPLNYWYLPVSIDDFVEFEKKRPTAVKEGEMKEKSWENVFNIESSKSIQATVWEIYKEQVKNIDHFISRG